MIASTSLMHPAMIRKIDAAMRAAVAHTHRVAGRFGDTTGASRAVWTASGQFLLSVIHVRGPVTRLQFVDHTGRDITDMVRSALRRSAASD